VGKRRFRRRCRTWLHPGAVGSRVWRDGDGESCASVGYVVLEDALELRYAIQEDDRASVPVRVTIPVTSVLCRFGGKRRYWLCPRCWRRCEIVVMATHARWWGCRRCMRLRHHSQGLAAGDRAERHADQLYARAGIEDDQGMIHKHKWMRWRTFSRLIDQANELSAAADASFLDRLRRLGFGSAEEALDYCAPDSK